MPELKHHFRKGRMNKDLDERLLPNGEYRDAQNIEIVTSEGSNVGAVQNVLGTTLKQGRLYDDSTDILTKWSADSDYFDLIDPTCIGSFVDNKNDKIYWFIHYSFTNDANSTITNASAIVEYDNTTDVIQPILVDINSILNFSSKYLITGVNIIDDLLFWTDNQTEPKRIRISTFKKGTAIGNDPFKEQSKYIADKSSGVDFTEKDITVIKQSPKTSPTLTLSKSKRGGFGTSESPIDVITSPDFNPLNDQSVREPLVAGDALTLTFDVQPNFSETSGDIVKLTFTENNNDPTTIDLEHKVFVKIDSITQRKSVTATIQSIPDSPPIGANLEWKAELSEEDPFFEKKFIRFSYRWKYVDGEYSTFAPFSEVAFLPSKFEYKSSDGYNIGMTNTARQIIINPIETPPFGVVEVDILYRESNNNNVYIIDQIKTDDLLEEFNPNGYQIKSEILGDIVDSAQTLRPWDNVPLKAKSQELIGNRILYGNYVQSYNIDNDRLPSILTTNNSVQITTVGEPEKSIKSQRTYQVGVVYLDSYGRETPVFSNKNASVTTSKDSAVRVNNLQCKIVNSAPTFATHFKYFVKESSTEYYNIALDRFYLAEDGNIWLSFPSSERNKITTEDYLILKKKHDEDTFVSQPAKYKILDIESEVPDFIAEELKSAGTATVKSRVQSNILLNQPRNKTSMFQFLGPTDAQNPSFSNGFTSDNSIIITTINSFGDTIATSARYEILKGGPTGKVELDLQVYEITLRKPISELDGEMFTANSLQNSNATAIEFKIDTYKKADKKSSEFSGRFFAKINRDSVFDDNIIESFPTVETDYVAVRSAVIIDDLTSDPREDKHSMKQEIAWRDKLTDSDSKAYWETNSGHPKSMKNTMTFFVGGIFPSQDNNSSTINPFLQAIVETGTVFQFENEAEELGSIYEVVKGGFVRENRSAKKGYQNRTAGRRRQYDIEFKKVSLENETSSTLFYDDKFLDNITYTSISNTGLFEIGDTNSKSIITKINIMRKLINTDYSENDNISSSNPCIFETEPRESVDIDIYHEASGALPIVKSGLKVTGHSGIPSNSIVNDYNIINTVSTLRLLNSTNNNSVTLTQEIPANTPLTFTDPKGAYSFTLKTKTVLASGSSYINIAKNQAFGQTHDLNWHNCYSFGQGVESNRIRDDYNATFLDKGPVVSTVLNEKYKQEHKPNTIIWSGLFNSTGGVNRTNEFIQAEKITKDINPEYGSIQKLHVRDTDLIAFCEDKVLRILANKDALYNADGNTNLISTQNVLGQAMPFVGEYGISKNPESFTSHAYRVYFADKARGSVLRLSRDGLTDIATKGMTDWFNDNLPLSSTILGSYNQTKGSYNLTLNNYTLSFDERVDGWTSFKSFLPQQGVSLNNVYFTVNNGFLYSHTNERRNSFYGILTVVKSALNNSTSLSISSQPSVKNISVGDYVVGDGIVGDVTVLAITYPEITIGGITIPNKASNTVVTLSSNQTIANSTNLTFIKTYDTSVTSLLNDEPSLVKEYKTLSYEGSKSRSYTYSGTISVDAAGNAIDPNITVFNGTTLDQLKKSNYNVNQIAQLTETYVRGWSGDYVKTNIQTGSVKRFTEKEGLWSNFITGDTTSYTNIDPKELSVQGIGTFTSISGATSPTQAELTISINGGSNNNNVDYSEAVKVINGIANGVSLSSNPGTIVLTMKPTTGYRLSASSFSIDTGNGVSSISFVQHGVNVKATLTLSGVMPSSDTSRVTTINGAAIANTYTVNGSYDTIEKNTTTGSSDNTAYSGSGTYDKKVVADASTVPITYTRIYETVFTKTFVANASHFFYTKPVLFIEEEDSSSISSYTITDNWATTTATVNGAVSNSVTVTLDAGHSGILVGMAISGVGLGQDVRVTALSVNTLTLSSSKTIPNDTLLTFTSASVTFDIKYVYGINNPLFDKLVFTAKAVEVFLPGITELTGFSGGSNKILSNGETRTMVISGSTGYDEEVNAKFTFTNEVIGNTATWSQSGVNAEITLSNIYPILPKAGMNVSNGGIPSGTTVSYVSVNASTGIATIHLILPDNTVISTPGNSVWFRHWWNYTNSEWRNDGGVANEITLPESGKASITINYNSSATTDGYGYYVRPTTPSTLSSTFRGNSHLISSNNTFAYFKVNQYAQPTISINASSNIVDDIPNAIQIRNTTAEVKTASSNAHINGNRFFTLSAVNAELKVGMLAFGNNIPEKTRISTIEADTNGDNKIVTLDKDPTGAIGQNAVLTFKNNHIYEAFGKPFSETSRSLLSFTVVAEVEGTSSLSIQNDTLDTNNSIGFDYKETDASISSISGNFLIFDSDEFMSDLSVSSTLGRSVVISDDLPIGTVYTIRSLDISNKKITLYKNGSIQLTSAMISDETDLAVGSLLEFLPPFDWDFSISNLIQSLSTNNKVFTLTGDMSINRYGYEDLSIALDLDKLITVGGSGSSGTTTVSTVFIQKTFSSSYYISSLVMYPKGIPTGTADGATIAFSGNVTGLWYGNAKNGIYMYFGPATLGFNNPPTSVPISFTGSFANGTGSTTTGTFSFSMNINASGGVDANTTFRVEPRIHLPIEP